MCLTMLLKNPVSDTSTHQTSCNPGGLNYMQIICIIWMGPENQMHNQSLNMSNFRFTDTTFRQLWILPMVKYWRPKALLVVLLCILRPDCIYEGAIKIKALLFKTHVYSTSLPGTYEYFTLFAKAQFSFPDWGYG